MQSRPGGPGEPDADGVRGPAASEAEVELARAGRWEDLAALLIEQAETAPVAAQRLSALVRAAQVFESHLGDADKAFLILLAAFQQDFTDERVTRALARLATEHGKWPDLLSEANALLAQLPAAERVPLLLVLAGWHQEHFHDEAGAEERLTAAVALDGRHPRALRALTAIYERRGDRRRALPLLEALADAGEADAELLLRIAGNAEALGDAARARAAYRRAYELDPGDGETVRRWHALATAHGFWDDVQTLSAERLAREADPDARFAGFVELARACAQLGDFAGAAEGYGRALDLRPADRDCREAAIDACTRAGNEQAALEHKRALAVELPPSDERAALLLEMARAARDQGDLAAAVRAYDDVLAVRPGSLAVTHELLDVLTAARHWKRAVALLQQLAAGEAGVSKAKYLVAAANILNYELHAADETIELYNAALDENPDDLKSFERIDKILTAKKAWRDEARNYRRMIKRLGASPEKKATLLLLWRGLGEIYRSRLKDLPAAAAAFEVCAGLAPDDTSIDEILAEIFEQQGAAGLPKAVERRTRLLARAGDLESIVRHLRVLRRQYFDYRQWDRVWCASAALVASGQGEPEAREFYARYAGPGVPAPRAGLTDEIWQKSLYDFREDPRLSRLFGIVSPAVALVRAQDPRAWGLDPRRRVHVEHDGSLLSHLLVNTARVLGVALPALYVHQDVPGELDLANVIEGGMLMPALVAGADLVAGRTEKELAFVLAKKLALLRPEHMVLWPHVVPSTAELKLIVLAVMKMFQPALELAEADQPAFRQYLTLFQRSLAPSLLEPLGVAVGQILADGGRVDVKAWAEGAEFTANRAGLLLCGDMVTAAQVLAAEAHARGEPPQIPVERLLRWSVSLEHLTLREQLGIALGADAGPARAPTHPGLTR